MKTNHRRGFQAKLHRDQACWSNAARSEFADVSFAAIIGNDFCNGNRGMARAKRGGKKFIRSRIRFHEKAATRRLAAELTD